MSMLLLDEEPLVISGFSHINWIKWINNLQQIHYWLKQNEKAKRNFRDAILTL